MVYSSWFTCDLGIQMMSVKGAAVVVMGRKLSSNVHRIRFMDATI